MAKKSGPSFRNAEMFLLGGAVGLLIEIVLRGEKKCPPCAPCNAGITPSAPAAPNASQVPR